MTLEFGPAEADSWTNLLKDLPLHTVLFEWIIKNMNMPEDVSAVIAYVALFLITWYTIIWSVRLVMSIIWPLFIIATAIVVFRLLQFYEPEEITTIMVKALGTIADTLVVILEKGLEFTMSFFED